MSKSTFQAVFCGMLSLIRVALFRLQARVGGCRTIVAFHFMNSSRDRPGHVELTPVGQIVWLLLPEDCRVSDDAEVIEVDKYRNDDMYY